MTLYVAAEQQLKSLVSQKESLGLLLSKRKQFKFDKKRKYLQKEIASLEKSKKYTFETMLQSWVNNSASTRHPDMTKLMILAALIPPSTAEVERSFSLMKLICTRLRNRLSQENLSNCMRICKFRKLTDDDYVAIFNRWLGADDTKSKKRKVASRFFIFYFFYLFFLLRWFYIVYN